MVENKQVMARNILKYMEIKNVKATDVCKALGFKQNTFSDWVNAKTYPRIDAIEKLANYFDISKAELVEEWNVDYIYHHTTKDGESIEIPIAVVKDISQANIDPIKRYASIVARKCLYELFNVAKDCTDEQIEVAINVLKSYNQAPKE